PNFRICIVSHSSKQAMSINKDLNRIYPDLKIKILTGSDSGATKKDNFNDINKTLGKCNIFIFSPVIESGVDITIPMTKDIRSLV
ncbi:MAG: hypothetical protein ACKPKO_59660, partial [Candidatus Fonsibacter sp.]